jgi:protein-tyrosine phosphatase
MAACGHRKDRQEELARRVLGVSRRNSGTVADTDAALDPLGRPDPSDLYRIMFVCTGNICRSPMAEVITRNLAALTPLSDGTTLGSHLEVTSAGTGPWHEGEPMDPRTGDALERAGYPRHAHIAHQVVTARLGQCNLVVALDRRHLQTLRGLGADPTRLSLLRAFDAAAGAAADVPDPYYGDARMFDDCLHMVTNGCRGLIDTLVTHWNAGPHMKAPKAV